MAKLGEAVFYKAFIQRLVISEPAQTSPQVQPITQEKAALAQQQGHSVSGECSSSGPCWLSASQCGMLFLLWALISQNSVPAPKLCNSYSTYKEAAVKVSVKLVSQEEGLANNIIVYHIKSNIS